MITSHTSLRDCRVRIFSHDFSGNSCIPLSDHLGQHKRVRIYEGVGDSNDNVKKGIG